jgi:hypothetical protein
MSGCYSLDPTGINAAYKEREYLQNADSYRLLRNVMVRNQKISNKMDAGSYLQIFYSFLGDILFAKGNHTIKIRQ